MIIETSELDGSPLDWAVAHAIGRIPHIDSDMTIQNRRVVYITCGGSSGMMPYADRWRPSFYWTQGGPLIYQIGSLVQIGGDWYAMPEPNPEMIELSGKTPLIATMRAIVAERLGEEVDIPDELLEHIYT